MPASKPPAQETADKVVWLVSYGDDDDRELTRPEIAEAIARGEIDGDTIVWREGLEDWAAVGDLPSLARLLPSSGETKNVAGAAELRLGAATTARRSNPPPFPRSRSSRPPPETEPDAAEPVRLEPESLDPRPAPERRPEASPPLPAARALSAGTFGIDLRDSNTNVEDALPSSDGTPSLTSLAAAGDLPTPRFDDAILAIGGNAANAEPSAPPTIDIGDIEQSAADDMPTSPVATAPFRTAPPVLDDSPPPGRDVTERPAGIVRSTRDRKDSKGAWLWIPLLGAGVVAIWAISSKPAPNAEAPGEEVRPEAAASEIERSRAVIELAPEVHSPPLSSQEPLASPDVTEPGPPFVKQRLPPPEPGKAPAALATRRAAPTPEEESETSDEPEPEEVSLAGPFDRDAANTALTTAAAEAASCRKEGDPSGRVVVLVTFSPSGRAVHAVVEGPPFAGTATGGCIATTLRNARIPPFSGKRITVGKTVTIQ